MKSPKPAKQKVIKSIGHMEGAGKQRKPRKTDIFRYERSRLI